MGKPVSNKFIKGPIRSWFRNDCSNCSQVLNCIPAGSLTLDDLEYFKRSRRMKVEITPAMIAGKEMHADILKDLQSLNQIGVNNFFERFQKGEKLQLRELMICNRNFGLRGVIDRFTIQRTGDKVDITIEELKSSFQKRYVIQLACFPKDTIIFTKKGLLPICNCKENMLVLTHKGRFKKITKIVKIPYSGETYKVFPYHSLPLDVTPEHPFLSAKIKQKFKKHYTEWDKKQKKYNHNRYDDEKGVSGFENLAWNKVSTLEKGDMLVIPKIKTKHIKIQNEILTLIGYYLAEGTLDFKYYYKHYGTPKNKRQVNKNNDNYYRISFSFAKDEQRYIEEIKNIAEKLQIKYKIYRYRKEIDFIELFSKRVYTFLYQFGKGALNKHLPMWALGLDNAQKMILLKSLWNGDGSGDIIEKLNGKIKNSALTTVSPILAKQTWFMLLNMNIPASIYKRMIKPNKLKNGHEIISRHEIYNIGINSNINKRGKRIAFDDRYIYLPIKKIEKKTINDFVYNLEVEKDNSYLAEGFAVHNCYALIMSNAGAEVVFDVPMKRPTKKRKTKRLGTKLYQGIDNPIINIDIKLIPVYSTMVYEKVWMNENKMSEWADGIQKSVYKYANHKRKFHKLGIYFVEDLKKPKVRSRQMYIGRRKLMVSNKPYIKKQPPAII